MLQSRRTMRLPTSSRGYTTALNRETTKGSLRTANFPLSKTAFRVILAQPHLNNFTFKWSNSNVYAVVCNVRVKRGWCWARWPSTTSTVTGKPCDRCWHLPWPPPSISTYIVTQMTRYCILYVCSSTIYDFHKLIQVLASLQSRVVLAAEMYHTASLMHDDVSLVRFVRKPSKGLYCRSSTTLTRGAERRVWTGGE